MYDNTAKMDSDGTDVRLIIIYYRAVFQSRDIRDNAGYNRQTEIMTTAGMRTQL